RDFAQPDVVAGEFGAVNDVDRPRLAGAVGVRVDDVRAFGGGLRDGHAERGFNHGRVGLQHHEGVGGVLVGRRADDAGRAAVLPALDGLGVTGAGHGAGDPVFGDPPHLVPVGGQECGGGARGGSRAGAPSVNGARDCDAYVGRVFGHDDPSLLLG